MAFHDGFDLPPGPLPERRSPGAHTAPPAPAAIPVECEWQLQAIEDAFTMLERMEPFPKRRERLAARITATLLAIQELTLGAKPARDDWHGFIDEMRAHARLLAQRAEAEPSARMLLELDLLAQRLERAANVATDALHEFFLAVALSFAA